MNKEKHSGYAPPFTVSSRAISLVAEISAQIERYAIRMEQADGLRLRKIKCMTYWRESMWWHL